mmetsp:Transcript_34651/g.73820  ORF Transcript_34651/g.73820 Transcript_34651/m.73820 type:complete len:351 (+) Transcript_34651:574-1626(+)
MRGVCVVPCRTHAQHFVLVEIVPISDPLKCLRLLLGLDLSLLALNLFLVTNEVLFRILQLRLDSVGCLALLFELRFNRVDLPLLELDLLLHLLDPHLHLGLTGRVRRRQRRRRLRARPPLLVALLLQRPDVGHNRVVRLPQRLDLRLQPLRLADRRPLGRPGRLRLGRGALPGLLGHPRGLQGRVEVDLHVLHLLDREVERVLLGLEVPAEGLGAPVPLVQLALEFLHPGALLGLEPLELGPEPFGVLVLLLQFDARGVELAFAGPELALQALDLGFPLGQLGPLLRDLRHVGRVGGSYGRQGLDLFVLRFLGRLGLCRCGCNGRFGLGLVFHELLPDLLQPFLERLHVV